MKKKTGLTLIISSILVGYSALSAADSHGGAATQDEQLKQYSAEAKKAIMAFGKTLKGELQTGMKAGGPINAIQVCNVRAPEITARSSADSGYNISRTSLKNRNPENAPNEWQTVVLEDFESRKAAGEAVDQLAYVEIVETGDGKEFRMMKAIPTGGVCLSCHGSNLDPKVGAKLLELYPEDKATGFSQGDIRGAFVATRKL